jgi:hypothetical protein
MRGLREWKAAVVVTGVLTACVAEAQQVEPWMIASRDGGCMELSVLKQALPDVGDAWTTPYELADLFRERNEKASTLRADMPEGPLIKVVVPSRRLDVVLLPMSVCRAIWQERLQRR